MSKESNGFQKGGIPWNKGTKGLYKLSEETRRKISISNKGKKKSVETRMRMSKSLIGNKRSWKKDKIRIFYCIDCGKEITRQARKCGHCSKLGLNILEKNGRWQNGKSFELYTSNFNKQLKDKIRVRDNFICQLCGVPELECKKRLSIHHIDYDKKNCIENNLTALCNKCNTKVNQDRNIWIKYFLNKMEKKNESIWLRI